MQPYGTLTCKNRALITLNVRAAGVAFCIIICITSISEWSFLSCVLRYFKFITCIIGLGSCALGKIDPWLMLYGGTAAATQKSVVSLNNRKN